MQFLVALVGINVGAPLSAALLDANADEGT